jgi:hypothetical protein
MTGLKRFRRRSNNSRTAGQAGTSSAFSLIRQRRQSNGDLMNKLLLSASILAAATTAIHVLMGGHDVAAPLLDSALAEAPRLTLYAVWHMATAALALSAAALFFGAMPRHATAGRSMVLFVSVLWLAFGAVFIVVAATQPGTGLYLKLPQWILLLPVGLLGVLGCSRPLKPEPIRGSA